LRDDTLRQTACRQLRNDTIRAVSGPRRLSQAISEGAGISVIVRVDDAEAARTAEEQGAEAVAGSASGGLREATRLPVLCDDGSPADAERAGADACLLVLERIGDDNDELEAFALEAHQHGLELVVDVHDEEELELALERLDPEIFLLSPRGADDDEEPLDRVLSLLPDVPAGKLAIADLPVRTREEVVALERAGFDAVLVPGGDVRELSGMEPPEV
jgi:indole-3-glycerol phosphate synthase